MKFADPIIQAEWERLCHSMAYGDDSSETFTRYCELAGWDLSPTEIEKLRQETFYETET